MSAPTTKSEYLLLFRDTNWHIRLSPADLQESLRQFGAWVDRLTTQGIFKESRPLEAEGIVVTGKNRLVTDGPFAESKEAIGGFFLLELNNLEEAVAIARECPTLKYGGTIEVRAIAPECVVSKSARQQAEEEVLAYAPASN
jgi:hypothetical protein